MSTPPAPDSPASPGPASGTPPAGDPSPGEPTLERLDSSPGEPRLPVAPLSSPVALSGVAASRLARAATTWTLHLREQTDLLRGKIARSVSRLTPAADPAAGGSPALLRFDARSLGAFWDWFDRATASWCTGNAALVATLGNEALGELRTGLLAGVRFDVRPAPLDPDRWAPPPLAGARPGAARPLAALRSPAALGPLGVAAAVAVAWATRPGIGNPWTPGAALALALLAAGGGAAWQHRRTLARLHERAVDAARRELEAAATARLEQLADRQLVTVQRHLTGDEMARWDQLVEQARHEQQRLDGETPAELASLDRTPAFLRLLVRGDHEPVITSKAPAEALHAIEDEPSLFLPPSRPVPPEG